jgi:glycine oxidase
VSNSRIIVAGGGLIGCSIAWRLAQRGHHVQVIESSRPGTAASWAAAGMLAPLIEAHHKELGAMARASIAQFPDFVRELHEASGIDAELQLTGKLDIAFGEAEEALMLARYGAALPEGVTEVAAAELAQLEPNLSPSISKALLANGDGSVDTRKLMRAAWLAASNAGVEFRTGSSVREVLCSRSGFEAAMLSTGERIEADAIVIAAGAWSSSIRGLPLQLPVFPVRGQLVALEAIPRALTHLVMSAHCYIVPRSDGRVLIGSTMERAGFDARTTAKGVAGLLDAAIRAVPALADAAVIDHWAGLRPGTSDDMPILGADPHAERVFYATGHFKNGILLAAVTAEVLAEIVSGEKPSLDIKAFSVSRFHE